MVAASHVIELSDVPPAEWFQAPTDVTPQGALTITDSGRVYGYLAPANVRHRSFPGSFTYTPLKKVDYGRFMGGETIVAGGARVVTGPITMNCGHASTAVRLTSDQAQEHYDNSCSVFARVAVGENEHGVWVAGALMPGVDGEQIQRAMTCRLSGDWRAHLDRPGWRELTAALLVPVPGFAMGRTAPSVKMKNGQLVSSAVPVRFIHDENTDFVAAAKCKKRRMMTYELAQRLGVELDPKVAELKARLGLKTKSFRDFSEGERKKLAKEGDALPDGAYPIENVEDLKNAIQAYGRSNPADRAKVRRHIMARARALGMEEMIPDEWRGKAAAADLAVVSLQSRLESMGFNPRERRDDHGRWTEGGPSSSHKLGPRVYDDAYDDDYEEGRRLTELEDMEDSGKKLSKSESDELVALRRPKKRKYEDEDEDTSDFGD
jgi:hypothetical protein